MVGKSFIATAGEFNKTILFYRFYLILNLARFFLSELESAWFIWFCITDNN